MEALIQIQSRLNAPKTLRNNFGGYNYRSAESILEAVKPLLKEYNCQLTLSDEIVMVGNRIYIKATATIFDGKETAVVSAYAREDESKKGMDGAQLTGATSSYARKYALNGLFCIDDNKDPDTDEYARMQKSGGKDSAKKNPGTIQGIINSLNPDSGEESKLKAALTEVANAIDKKSLADAFKRHPELQSHPTFTKCCSARKKELGL